MTALMAGPNLLQRALTMAKPTPPAPMPQMGGPPGGVPPVAMPQMGGPPGGAPPAGMPIAPGGGTVGAPGLAGGPPPGLAGMKPLGGAPAAPGGAPGPGGALTPPTLPDGMEQPGSAPPGGLDLQTPRPGNRARRFPNGMTVNGSPMMPSRGGGGY